MKQTVRLLIVVVLLYLAAPAAPVAAQTPARPSPRCGLWCRFKKVFRQPSQAEVKAYMCQELGFCGQNARRLAVGSNFNCYTDDYTKGARARIVCPDPGYPRLK